MRVGHGVAVEETAFLPLDHWAVVRVCARVGGGGARVAEDDGVGPRREDEKEEKEEEEEVMIVGEERHSANY